MSVANQGLRKTLRLFDAFSIGINAIIGAGIFVAIGVAAGFAGPALLASIALAFLISSLTAISFVKLSRRITLEGGVYAFSHELMPKPVGFMTGWLWISSNIIAGSAVAIGFAQYASFLLPTSDIRMVAAAASLFFTAVNYYGIKASAVIGNVINIIKLGILLLFIISGISFINTDNFQPFAPNGAGGILTGASLIFFAFTGFARITTVAGEVVNPEHTVPRAIVLSLVVSAAIYMLVAFVSLGLSGYSALSTSLFPLADAIGSTGLPGGSIAITFGALIATSGVLLTSVLGVSRVAYSMAQMGDLPKLFSAINNKRNVPHYAIIISGLTMALLAGTVNFEFALNGSSASSLLYYAVANASALKLKIGMQSAIISLMGVVTCASLLVFLSIPSLLFTLAIVIAGFLYFISKNRRH